MSEFDDTPESPGDSHQIPNGDRAFVVGDRVVDRDADLDDRSVAVVLDYRRDADGDLVPAWAAPIAALDGTTVAEANPDYDMNDPVVIVAFERHLDEYIGERWRAWADDADFPSTVTAYAD